MVSDATLIACTIAASASAIILTLYKLIDAVKGKK